MTRTIWPFGASHPPNVLKCPAVGFSRDRRFPRQHSRKTLGHRPQLPPTPQNHLDFTFARDLSPVKRIAQICRQAPIVHGGSQSWTVPFYVSAFLYTSHPRHCSPASFCRKFASAAGTSLRSPNPYYASYPSLLPPFFASIQCYGSRTYV